MDWVIIIIIAVGTWVHRVWRTVGSKDVSKNWRRPGKKIVSTLTTVQKTFPKSPLKYPTFAISCVYDILEPRVPKWAASHREHRGEHQQGLVGGIKIYLVVMSWVKDVFAPPGRGRSWGRPSFHQGSSRRCKLVLVRRTFTFFNFHPWLHLVVTYSYDCSLKMKASDSGKCQSWCIKHNSWHQCDCDGECGNIGNTDYGYADSRNIMMYSILMLRIKIPDIC